MRKIIGLLVLSGFVVGLVAPGLAMAEEDSKSKESIKFEHFLEGKGEFKFDKFPPGLEKRFEVRTPSLTVSPQGKTMIVSGEVVEANLPNIKVKVWGLTLTANIPANVDQIGRLPGDTATGVKISVGDKVDILGSMDASTGVITATQFKNRTEASKNVTTIQERIKKLLEELEQLRKAMKQAGQ